MTTKYTLGDETVRIWCTGLKAEDYGYRIVDSREDTIANVPCDLTDPVDNERGLAIAKALKAALDAAPRTTPDADGWYNFNMKTPKGEDCPVIEFWPGVVTVDLGCTHNTDSDEILTMTYRDGWYWCEDSSFRVTENLTLSEPGDRWRYPKGVTA